MNKKPWYLSSTLWTNAMVFLASALAGFGVAEIGMDEQSAVVAGIVSLINIVLRFKTSQPVGGA